MAITDNITPKKQPQTSYRFTRGSHTHHELNTRSVREKRSEQRRNELLISRIIAIHDELPKVEEILRPGRKDKPLEPTLRALTASLSSYKRIVASLVLQARSVKP